LKRRGTRYPNLSLEWQKCPWGINPMDACVFIIYDLVLVSLVSVYWKDGCTIRILLTSIVCLIIGFGKQLS
jgi:hypothetical protein